MFKDEGVIRVSVDEKRIRSSSASLNRLAISSSKCSLLVPRFSSRLIITIPMMQSRESEESRWIVIMRGRGGSHDIRHQTMVIQRDSLP
jgi:hypothetical protein